MGQYPPGDARASDPLGGLILSNVNCGRVTLPAESGHEAAVAALARQWGADAIRDSDGTRLSEELLALGGQVYSTLCLVRADQDFVRSHRHWLARKFFMSDPVTATGATVSIPLLAGFYARKYEVDVQTDPGKYWEVVDRTTGSLVPNEQWKLDASAGAVTVTGACPFHVYTVSFLALLIWDTTSMYNHLVNGWQGPPVASVDPFFPEVRAHLLAYFDRWLAQHARTDVVRFTTFAYHFVVDSGSDGSDRYRDWLGYGETVSVPALEAFERAQGYRMRAEDFVDEGYYNTTNRVPSPRYRAWMRFIHRFVVDFARELAEKAHRAGKRTAMFQGDHWIGTEPFSEAYPSIGIDINIGAVEDGVALRRLSDSPGPAEREARLYPYFFPDVFRPGADPRRESVENWAKIRRALLRKPIHRIGYGGYPSLAAKFPEFVHHVGGLCDEFRAFLDRGRGTRPYTAPVTVAVLSAWGSWRAWLQNPSLDQKFHVPSRPDVMELVGSNPLECLAGLPVNVVFLDFEQLKDRGVPGDVNVILNTGDAGTSWSGGRHWGDPEVVSRLRAWVHGGGGLIGIGGPSAWQHQGRCFQLSDVLGVERETGNTLGVVGKPPRLQPEHFLTAGAGAVDFGNERSYVYACPGGAEVLRASGAHVLLSANRFGGGRAVYMAGLSFSPQNARLLLRALHWAARQESCLDTWLSANPGVDCALFPETGWLAAVNFTSDLQETTVRGAAGAVCRLRLQPYEWQWLAVGPDAAKEQ